MATAAAAAVGGSGPPRGKSAHRVRAIVAPLIIFVGMIALWYLVSLVLMPAQRRFLVPTPDAVVVVSFLNVANRQELFDGLWVTAGVALTGLGIATVVGIAAAVVMSMKDWVEASFYPYAILLQVVPILAIAPLIGLLFGFGFNSRVTVCVLIALFPIITNTLFGLKSADVRMHEMFTLMGVGRTRRLLKLQFPAAMPAIFTGIQIAAGLAVVGAVVGDFFFQRGEAGLGVLLQRYSTQLLTPQLYGSVVLSAALGVVVFGAARIAMAIVTGKWYSPTTK